MSVNAEYIKQKALEYGAAVCGVASVERFKDERPECNPASISPFAKSVIGFGFYVPSGFYRAMENGTQRAYSPGSERFGTEYCGGNMCLPLCLAYSLCNGGWIFCC